MPTWLYLLTIAVLTLLGGVQAGVLLWVAVKAVRVRGVSLRSALIWCLLLMLAQVLVFVAAIALASQSADAIWGAAMLVFVIATGFFLKRTGEGGVNRSVLAVLVWLALSAPLTLAESRALRSSISDSYYAGIGAMAMKPTLEPSDRFVCDRTLAPNRWDLVTYDPPPSPGEIWIARIVALPGETVEIIGGRVHINGAPTPGPAIEYLSELPSRGALTASPGHPVTLGDDEYFVLGDNSPNAFDSRVWPKTGGRQAGALPASHIIGVVRLIYAPLSRARVFR